jgi:signal transduction histidine kinase
MASVSLLSRLAHTPRLTELLPPLHEYALQSTGGSCSVLFELNPRDSAWYATSGFGLDELGSDPWTPDDPQRHLLDDMFRRHASTLVTDHGREMPDLVLRLGAPATLLIPLALGERRLGLLVIGFGSVPAGSEWKSAAEIGDAFTSVLEFARLRQKEELESDLQALLDRFGESLSTTLSLTSGLEVFCHGARQLFAADRAAAWMHDRRVHDLVLLASSDPPHVARGTRLSTEAQVPAALGMRRSRAEIVPGVGDVPTSTITLPLRGRRRSLGCVVFEGVRVETGRELDILERADELGRHLSGAVENLQLLDEVIRARRELESSGGALPVPLPAQPGGRGSEQLAALNQLVATIAHEVNNPLQTGLGHLELLRSTATLPKPVRRQVQAVYRAADRAARVVRNLLVFAGSRRLNRRPVSLHAVLQKVLSNRASACRSLQIEVVRHYGRTVPRVQSDPLLLHQVFLNIVLNAEQAIAATARPGRIEVTTSASAGRVVATVRDSGNGIAPEAMSRVFEPFYTTKEGSKATGLGLAIAQGIVLEHGGRMSAANHPNGGAAFTVELPVGQKSSPVAVG